MGDSQANHVWLRYSALCCVASCQSIRWVASPSRSLVGTQRTQIFLLGPDEEEQERVIHQQILMAAAAAPILGSDKSGTERITGTNWMKAPHVHAWQVCCGFQLSVSSKLGFRPDQVYPQNGSSNLSWRLETRLAFSQERESGVFLAEGTQCLVVLSSLTHSGRNQWKNAASQPWGHQVKAGHQFSP